ncbi:hypothetical protein B296_00013933 [Ensete ventricosum]|uniref:Uncharacterized protein n=1 Tax=Ensete ventricosum TaxID=4639 RepID=A0A426ZFM6_ENSVE|nr:hypothetical protein B296_00013933 [Ensete ventricosum]
MEARRAIEAEDSELALDLALALHHSKEAEARPEEAQDKVAAIGDEAVESTMEDKQQVEFRYQIATSRFKVRYPELEVDEVLPLDVKVPIHMEVPFDDRPTTLPSPSAKLWMLGPLTQRLRSAFDEVSEGLTSTP